MRNAAKCCFTVGDEKFPCSSLTKAAESWPMLRSPHHSAKRCVEFRYALRAWSLWIWAVKNSRTGLAAFGMGVNRGAGCSSAVEERTSC